jgi:hypothetical protein
MLSLYFNTRITESLLISDTRNSAYFYPIVYPQSSLKKNSQYSILIKTINSYSSIKFDVAIFNIEIDEITFDKKKELEKLISDKITANKKIVSFKRPCNIKEWRDNVQFLIKIVNKNDPVLIVMNHDHPFIDYKKTVFIDVVNEIFNLDLNNMGKALYYSHAPEVISWALNGRGKITYIKDGNFYISKEINDWIDSICVISAETLEHIWGCIIFDDDAYIGRFDWNGAHFKNLKIKSYVYPREFFKHYDGYGHITGIREISEVPRIGSPTLNLPSGSLQALVDYYYQRWIDSFILSVRDYVIINRSLFKSNSNLFKEAIERSLMAFNSGYIFKDAKNGIIKDELLQDLVNGLREKIYFNGNNIFLVIHTDINLLENSTINKYKKNIKKFLNLN